MQLVVAVYFNFYNSCFVHRNRGVVVYTDCIGREGQVFLSQNTSRTCIVSAEPS